MAVMQTVMYRSNKTSASIREICLGLSYCISNTPQINTIVYIVSENSLWGLRAWRLKELERLISMSKCLSKVHKFDVFPVFFNPVFPDCGLHQLLRQATSYCLTIQTNKIFPFWRSNDSKTLLLRQMGQISACKGDIRAALCYILYTRTQYNHGNILLEALFLLLRWGWGQESQKCVKDRIAD